MKGLISFETSFSSWRSRSRGSSNETVLSATGHEVSGIWTQGTVSFLKLDCQTHSRLSNHHWNLTSSSYPIDSVCVCVCVCVRARERVRESARVCASGTLFWLFIGSYVCFVMSRLCAPIWWNSTYKSTSLLLYQQQSRPCTSMRSYNQDFASIDLVSHWTCFVSWKSKVVAFRSTAPTSLYQSCTSITDQSVHHRSVRQTGFKKQTKLVKFSHRVELPIANHYIYYDGSRECFVVVSSEFCCSQFKYNW